MAHRSTSSWVRRGALVLAGGALAALSGCVVAPVDPYYDVGAPVAVQLAPTYYYGAPYYAPRPYYAAPPVSIGIWGRFGGHRGHGHGNGHGHGHGHGHRR